MTRLLLAVLVTSGVACAAEELPDDWDRLGTPDSPVPQQDAYRVASRFNFSVEMPQLEGMLANLRAFSQNPARTLLAQAAGEAALALLVNGLPTTLEDQLEGWINAELDKVLLSGKSLRQYAGEMAGIAEIALTQFRIDSSLSIARDKVMHSLTGLTFTPAALDIVIPIGGLKADTLSEQTTAVVGAGGALTVAEQQFGLAFGNHAWQAINLASNRLFGSDVRTTLTNAVSCEALSGIIAAKCVSASCVGHQAELKAVCVSGLEALVGELHERIPALQLEEFRFTSGRARLVDDNYDGIADQIVDGMWSLEVDFGSGPRTLPATFSAVQ